MGYQGAEVEIPSTLGTVGWGLSIQSPRPVTFSDLTTKIIFYVFFYVKEDGKHDLDLSTRSGICP